MGLDLVYASGAAKQAVRFTDAEWACIERLGTVASTHVEALFNAPVFGEPVPVAANELLAAVDALLALLRDRPDLQPSTYQMRMERYPLTGQPDGTWQGGAISGLRLPGESDYFMLRVGPDQCELERMRVGSDGRGILLGSEDLRERTSIETETVGRIDLRRRPARATLKKRLAALREFFAGQAGGRVTKILC